MSISYSKINKSKLVILHLIIFLSLKNAFASPSDYIPNPALGGKKLEDYTVNDVIGGTFASKGKLDDSHPFRKINDSIETVQEVKLKWPGAKQASNLDAIYSLIVHTENLDQERYVSMGIYWLIYHIMDVPNSDKVDAFIRVYQAQNEPLKKRKVAFLVQELFPYLADERMLLSLKDMLDDNSTYRLDKAEGIEPKVDTTRRFTKQIFTKLLSGKNLLSYGYPEGEIIVSRADRALFSERNLSESDSCGLYKKWLTDNWQLIAAQCKKLRDDTEREYIEPSSLRLIPPISRWRTP